MYGVNNFNGFHNTQSTLKGSPWFRAWEFSAHGSIKAMLKAHRPSFNSPLITTWLIYIFGMKTCTQFFHRLVSYSCRIFNIISSRKNSPSIKAIIVLLKVFNAFFSVKVITTLIQLLHFVMSPCETSLYYSGKFFFLLETAVLGILKGIQQKQLVMDCWFWI